MNTLNEAPLEHRFGNFSIDVEYNLLERRITMSTPSPEHAEEVFGFITGKLAQSGECEARWEDIEASDTNGAMCFLIFHAGPHAEERMTASRRADGNDVVFHFANTGFCEVFHQFLWTASGARDAS